MIACSATTLERVSREDVAERAPIKEHDRLPSACGPHTNEKPARIRTAEPRSVDVCNPTFKDRAAEHCIAPAAAALTRRNRGRATLFHGVPPTSCCAFRGRCELLGLRCVNTDRFTAREDCDRRPCERPPHYNETMPDTPPARHPIPALSSKPPPTKPRSLVSSEPDWPGPTPH